jgi:hypothetical protein
VQLVVWRQRTHVSSLQGEPDRATFSASQAPSVKRLGTIASRRPINDWSATGMPRFLTPAVGFGRDLWHSRRSRRSFVLLPTLPESSRAARGWAPHRDLQRVCRESPEKGIDGRRSMALVPPFDGTPVGYRPYPGVLTTDQIV